MTRLDVPPLYEVVKLEHVDDISAEAARLAESGADEGTLIWARAQTRGRARGGQTWESPAGGLYAALLMRPECPRVQAAELALVASVSLGEAIADWVEPPTELRFRWPNDVLVGHAKAATVNLIADDGHDQPGWLAIVLQANVAGRPGSLGFNASSLRGDGASTVTPAELLETFSRAFLAWVNRWAEEGFEPILHAWRLRANDPGAALVLRVGDTVLRGHIDRYGPDGALCLASEDGQVRRIRLDEAFGLAP